MDGLDKATARAIVEQLGSTGTPPHRGLRHFTVGLDPYLNVLEHEYLNDFIAAGGSSFKLVKGIYGGGKTHFLYCLRDLAWKHDYVVSYTELGHMTGSPFYEMGKVFSAITTNLLAAPSSDSVGDPTGFGIDSFLKSWYAAKQDGFLRAGYDPARTAGAIEQLGRQISGLPSSSLQNALIESIQALARDDELTFSRLCQWMKGQMAPDAQLKRLMVTEKVDDSTAFRMLRSLVQALRVLGHRGMIILFDETEAVSTLSTKNRIALLNNLRALIDGCGSSQFAGAMVFYSVPDLNFLEGRDQVYVALNQRLTTILDEFNPHGVRIDLDEGLLPNTLGLDPEAYRLRLLEQMGERIAQVYDVAYGTFLAHEARAAIQQTAREAHAQRYGDGGYRREFVKQLVLALNGMRTRGRGSTRMQP